MVSAQFFVTLFYKTPGSFEALFTRCPPDMTYLLNSFITVTARSVLFYLLQGTHGIFPCFTSQGSLELISSCAELVSSSRYGMHCFFVSLSLILVPHRGNKPNPTGHEGHV